MLRRGDAQPAREADLETVADLIMGFRGAKTVFTAASLGVFDRLADSPKSARALGRTLGTRPRPTEALLDALAALGFLRKSRGRYENGELASKQLLRGENGSLGDVLRLQNLLWTGWSELERVLREGRPRRKLSEWMGEIPGFTRDYIRSMHQVARKPASEVARAVPVSGSARLLDIGCGPGSYSLAFAERNPKLRADLLDLPQTLAITREFTAPSPAKRRLRLVPGDYRRLALAPRSYDLVLLSHVTHNEGEAFNRRLLRESRAALRPGGRLVIHDFMTRSDGTGPLFASLFSVHVAVYTEQGRAYRARTYREWMKAAGFLDIREKAISAGSPNASRILVGARG